MNIISLINQVDSGEIVLPAIQRSFIWSEDKIERLMDSVMRGYPIGIVLMWESYKDIQFRSFERVFQPGNRPKFLDNSSKKKLRLVLDGQQRLQSLYMALFGKYDQSYLYFDVLSGRESDDFEEEKYHFYFMTPEESEEWNSNCFEEAVGELEEDEEREDASYLSKVPDL